MAESYLFMISLVFKNINNLLMYKIAITLTLQKGNQLVKLPWQTNYFPIHEPLIYLTADGNSIIWVYWQLKRYALNKLKKQESFEKSIE